MPVRVRPRAPAQGFLSSDIQLAHAERNKVRAAYNRASRLAERRNMMQVWADCLDALRGQGGTNRRSGS